MKVQMSPINRDGDVQARVMTRSWEGVIEALTNTETV
jgi:hypothetical protein